MIILAATIIISLTNNGIIDKANDAVDKTNEKQVQELANLAWADVYADNVGKSDEELLPLLKQSVEKALTDNNLDKEDYGMEVTTTGVTIVKGWLQTKDRTVVKGSTTLEIGDYVNYVSGVEGYTDINGWQVLGAENGELLILSSQSVVVRQGWGGTEEISVINEKCEIYGKGKYATGARSIKVEDIDRITGYDKTIYGKGETKQYGNIVIYKYNGTECPSYETSNNLVGTVYGSSTSGFKWYDNEEGWKNIDIDTLKANTTGKICVLTSTGYTYDVVKDTNLKQTDKAYIMLFGSNNDSRYWLASKVIFCWSDIIDFDGLYVNSGKILEQRHITSDNISAGSYLDIRAVVQLSPEYNP